MSNLTNLQALLKESQVHGAILSSPLTQRYITGFDYTDGYVLVSIDRAWLLADSRYVEAARNSVSEDIQVICPEVSMLDTLAQLTQFNALTKIVLEDQTLSCAAYKKLSEKLAGTNLYTGASEMVTRLRAVKNEEELAIIAEAQDITDRAFEHILTFIKPGVTERQVAFELENFMRMNGAEDIAFETIAVSGPATSMPHGVPADIPLREGFLTMDFGAKVKGYCSDMTRTVVLGKATAEMKKVYETVLAAQTAALEMLGEGVVCREADEAARSVIREAGFGEYFGHSLGHGVGIEIHEAPNLSPKAPEDSKLRRGNVVTVEPGIYIAGQFGCRIEDMVAIDLEGNLLNFTKSPKELIEIPFEV